MRIFARNMLRKAGYDIVPYQTYRGRPFPERPWEDDPKYVAIYNEVYANTLLDRRRLYMLYQLACKTSVLPGHFAECGVFQGGSARLLALIKPAEKCLHLFDTFEGMPDTNPKWDHHQAKDFLETSFEKVQTLLQPYPNVQYHKGFFPKSAEGLKP